MQKLTLFLLGTFILALLSFELLQFFKVSTSGLFRVIILFYFLIFLTVSTGQASGENAKAAGEVAKDFADLSWSFAQKQELVNKKSNVPSIGPIAVNVCSLGPKAQMIHKEVHEFVREIILPIEQELRNHTESEDWKPSSLMEELKVGGISKIFLFIKGIL